jgi:hypothetical protein
VGRDREEGAQGGKIKGHDDDDRRRRKRMRRAY